MKSLLFFIAIVSGSWAWGQRTFIHEGISLKSHQLPQVVTLKNLIFGTCTGQLVGPQAILTAAHCCEAGIYRPASLGKAHNYEIHPQYKATTRPYYGFALPEVFTYENDLCLIQLESPVGNIRPLSIPNPAAENQGQHFIVGVGQPNKGTRQYGLVEITKASEKGYQARGSVHFGKPGDSGGSLLVGNLGGTVAFLGVTSVSTSLCGLRGVVYSENNSHHCSIEESKKPGDVFIPPRTTGFASLSNPSNRLFLEQAAQKHSLEICGINKNCEPVVFEK